MEKMKAVRKLKSAPGLEYTETDIPKIGDKDVLVKVKACSMCGTDLHIYNWDPPWSEGRVKPPRTLGHEVAGEVVEVGKDVGLVKVGDFISAESHIYCGKCYQCRTGNAHICQNMKLLGVGVDGGFAEYVKLPECVLWKNPKNMPPEVATLQESLGNSVYTVQEGNVMGKTVTVFGCGPTGLFAIGVARATGATKIIAISGTKFHLNLAKKMGADIIINRHEQDVIKVIMDVTDGIGADVFLEMSGSPVAINQGLKSMMQGGKAVLLGLPTKEVSLDISRDVVLKLANIQGIYGRKMFDTWYTTTRLLHSGRLDITPIITHKFKLSEFEKGIKVADSGNAGKVILLPD